MNPRRHREFGSAIITDTRGRFLLQQREDIPGILYPGMLGLFGGHRERGETFLECAVREIHEEISYFVSPERFEWLANYRSVDADGCTVSGEFFVVRDVPIDAVRITEGHLFIAERKELPALAARFEPSAQVAIDTFLNQPISQTTN